MTPNDSDERRINVSPGASRRPVQTLDDWTHVYDGLSDEEIEAVDQVAKTRADLARNLPHHRKTTQR